MIYKVKVRFLEDKVSVFYEKLTDETIDRQQRARIQQNLYENFILNISFLSRDFSGIAFKSLIQN